MADPKPDGGSVAAFRDAVLRELRFMYDATPNGTPMEQAARGVIRGAMARVEKLPVGDVPRVRVTCSASTSVTLTPSGQAKLDEITAEASKQAGTKIRELLSAEGFEVTRV